MSVRDRRRQLLERIASRSGFTRALSGVNVHRGICCVVLLQGTGLSGALAQDIPSGFRVDRYVRVWERNPFILVEPTAPQNLPSPFEKLFLAGWLKDGSKEVILVQNSQTNEVQTITAVPNQNNLRLVKMHTDSNPQFVAVVISDGKEQGTVKFRFDKNATSVPTSAAPAQVVARVPVESGPKQPPVRRKHLMTDPDQQHRNAAQN